MTLTLFENCKCIMNTYRHTCSPVIILKRYRTEKGQILRNKIVSLKCIPIFKIHKSLHL